MYIPFGSIWLYGVMASKTQKGKPLEQRRTKDFTRAELQSHEFLEEDVKH